ncbi:MAG: type 4a pilus biogenesis protein PilO [Candidatus Hydrogenedentota bacterium]
MDKNKRLTFYISLRVIVYLLIPASIILVYYYGIKPLKQIKDTRLGVYNSLNTEIAKIDSLLKEQENITSFKQEIEKKYEYISKHLGDRDKSSLFFSEIDKAIESNSLQLIRLIPLEVIIKQDYREYPVRVTLSGDFKSIIGFLKDMKQSRFINTIDSLSLKKSGSINQLTLFVDLVIYFLY